MKQVSKQAEYTSDDNAMYYRFARGSENTIPSGTRTNESHPLVESIDTNTPLGSAVFKTLGAVAQLERDLIAERVRNGLANAKAKGVRLGRIKTRDSDLIRKLRASGMTCRRRQSEGESANNYGNDRTDPVEIELETTRF